MKRVRDFLRMWGDFDDGYTWLIWACIIGVWVVPIGGWQWPALVVVEVVTVVMRFWTRDVREAQVERKRQRKGPAS